MEKILSIVIPTYNMENYLRHCLDSLLIKEGLNDVEILVVNDGSKDSSLEIAREYESKFPKSFRVIDKENGNYGSCVNRGLKEAKGKYIKVLDADDSFNTDTFEDYVSLLKTIDVDLVLTDFLFVDESDKEVRNRRYDYIPANKVLDFKEVCKNGLDFFNIMMHAVTYKRDNLIKMNYKQTEGVSYTDNQWVFTPMLQVKTVYHLDKFLYLYLIGREGQTVDVNVKYNSKSFRQEIKVTEDMISQIKPYKDENNIIYKGLIFWLHRRLRWIYNTVLVERRKNISADMLIDFDKFIEKESMDNYRYLDTIHYKKIRHVRMWRKNNYRLSSIFFIYCNVMAFFKK